MICSMLEKPRYGHYCLMVAAVGISFYVVLRNRKACNGRGLDRSDDSHLVDKAEDESNWDKLPKEVLDMILRRLILPDCVRFGAVCRWWRRVEKERCHPPMPQLPWLMLNNVDRDLDNVKFYSLSEDRFYTIELPCFSLCTAAYDGWLLMHSIFKFPGFENRSFLLNPISGAQILLPKPEIYSTEGNFIRNAILSSEPSSIENAATGCLAVGVCDNGKLAFCKLGEARWSILEAIEGTQFHAVAYYKGALYGLDRTGGFWVFELSHHPTATKLDILFPVYLEDILSGVGASLVVLGEDLILVLRILNVFLENYSSDDWFYVPPETDRFEIFKLDWDISKWVEVDSLADHMLFMSRKPHDFPVSH